MKAQELRIGNLIKDPILTRKVDAGLLIAFQNNKGYIDLYQPIPLTEEWLLKFGYKKNEYKFFVFGHLVCKCNYMFMCDKNGIALKHVHQLQNLYFALTGCELEIK